ncbi:4a-hydroxytetrahydrobiopterin dehydratase [Pyruvatibacter sp.]|uniref:4a-hydroxytetrahydrobiopterin dehydratase n=1 Tax=Pyruvatibacter sp. TaxID=1981328 RepID=UPI0032EDF179
MEKLTEDQVAERLKAHAQWSEMNGAIQRTFQHKDFVAAMAFVNKIAEMAEEKQHHPDILIRYNKVTLTLSTHDAGGITDKDFDFADAADGVR